MKKILEPFAINGMELRNRMVVSAMGTVYFDENGLVTDRYLSYIKERALGGWGLIITEICRVSPEAGHIRGLPGIYSEEQIENHRRVTRTVHEAGGRIAMQIYHAGWRAPSRVTGVLPMGPSPVPAGDRFEMPREMSLEDIRTVVEQFSDAALNARNAGYDGVELHCGHGFLLGTFLSGTSNKRGDEYGGTIENRARIVLEIIRRVREKVGRDYPFWCKLSVHEYMDGGLEPGDAQVFARMFEEAGVDAIHCSQGNHLSNYATIPPSITARGHYLPNAAAVRQAVHIPVIAVGRINDPLVGEKALAAGQCDLVAMARASLADPRLPRKVAEGRTEDIARCIGCLQGCIGEFAKGRIVRCMVNPLTGMEGEYDLSPATERRAVFIAGGGVSGCEAALAAAMRGHKVTVFEKSDRLGGQWLAAAVPPGKEEFASFVCWQKRMLDKLGVTVRLNEALTRDIVESEKPDVVIVATGSQATVPPIRGIDQDHIVPANDVLLGKARTGRNVVIIGGGMVGVETADFLSAYGKDVTVVEMLEAVAAEAEPNSRHFLMQRIRRQNVRIITEACVQEIGEKTVRVLLKSGEEVLLPADNVVLAAGLRSENALAAELNDCAARVAVIGDAREVKNGLFNIQEGFEAGLNV